LLDESSKYHVPFDGRHTAKSPDGESDDIRNAPSSTADPAVVASERAFSRAM